MTVEPPGPAAGEARHALVLSGGGAEGAYEVGVVRALFEGASPATRKLPLLPRIYTGTSIGAYNAAFRAQDWAAGARAAGDLDEVWRRRIASSIQSCGNGVYRLRADPLRWVEPGCAAHPLDNLAATAGDAAYFAFYGLTRGLNLLLGKDPVDVRLSELVDLSALFSSDPMRSLLAETIDLGRLAASPHELAIAATDWTTGRPVIFDKAQIAGPLGTDAIRASGAIPGIFPPVPLAGKLYADGALRMNTPLRPAIQAGADVLHVVYVDPDVADIPFPRLPNTLDTLYRVYVILVASHLNHDIFVAALVNEDRILAERLGIGANDGRLAGLPRLERVMQRARSGEPYRPLEIHRYRPRLPLSDLGGLLDFNARQVDGFIQQGYDDAVHHDCSAEQCILPPMPGGGAAGTNR
ncbi:MAG TPA: patatin-like phospholipase family protein [Thermoanaerobaculia bacterium]|nr:patatin-like phospholipase family protein [Thermoanaerobaculia bacterium]